MAQWVKNPSAMEAMQETQVQSLGQEDPLETDMATLSSIYAWRILWAEEPGRPHGCKELDTIKAAEHTNTRIKCSFNPYHMGYWCHYLLSADGESD